jgi:hypothetical protein
MKVVPVPAITIPPVYHRYELSNYQDYCIIKIQTEKNEFTLNMHKNQLMKISILGIGSILKYTKQ